ncbi:MAG: phage tail assembly chaperone [Novosphingobium sp.]
MSGGRFADGARRLSGQAALLLGWRPDDFWAATPAELAAIFAARDEAGGSAAGLSRTDLDRMMEHDGHG